MNKIEVISQNQKEAIVTLSYRGRDEIEIYLTLTKDGLIVESDNAMCCVRQSKSRKDNKLRIFPYITPFKEPHEDE